MDGMFQGSCAGWHYNSLGGKCSLRTGKNSIYIMLINTKSIIVKAKKEKEVMTIGSSCESSPGPSSSGFITRKRRRQEETETQVPSAVMRRKIRRLVKTLDEGHTKRMKVENECHEKMMEVLEEIAELL